MPVPTADLFIDLYSYRQRENKNPLEDWLTECLAVTIRALPAQPKAVLLSVLSGAPIDDAEAFFSKHEIKVLTQYLAGDAGRPDMLILLDGNPWILFENKVSHGVSMREDPSGGASHQLRGYADWLANRAGECAMPCALIFVTHITPPPPDFRGDDATGLYHGLRRAHTSWGSLGRDLVALTGDLPDEHHSKAIAEAFLTYLESQNMSNEFPSSAAFAAAELYVTQADALENLVDRMWEEFKTVANFGKTSDTTLKALTEEGSVSAWRFLAPRSSSKPECFLQTGIWFPETGLWLDDEDLLKRFRGAQAYVFFGSRFEDSFAATKRQPEGYVRPWSDFLLCKPIAEFAADPQVRGDEIIAWVARQAQVMKAFLTDEGLIV